MKYNKHLRDSRYGLRSAGLIITVALLFALAGCGGSMGSDPATSASGQSDPPAASDPPSASAVAPTASAGSVSGNYYSTFTGTLSGSNPCNCGTPVFALASQPTHGTLTLSDATKGTFSYTPYPGFTGTDSFVFALGNGQATSATATETVTVNPAAVGAQTVPANIGTNLDGVVYYSISQPYVDMMNNAGGGAGRTWVGTGATAGINDLAQAGLLDANGWPKADAAVIFACCLDDYGNPAKTGAANELNGDYQLSFNGKAQLNNVSGTAESQQYDAATNTTTATLVLNGGTQLDVTFTNTQRTADSPTNTGITNVRVIRPQFAPDGTKWWDSPNQEFTDPFLASLVPFSTLRFMDWTMTNGSQVANWDQRTPPDWPGGHEIETDGAWEWNVADQKTELTNGWWSGTGQSWQNVIDLANVTGKDIWINIPVRATDDYVKSLATLLKQKLHPGIHVYVEYSNEVWNYNFEQFHYNDAATDQLLATDATAAANYQADCVNSAQDMCHVAERLMQISNDFAAVWGQPAINAAIRPVFCSQLVGITQMQMALAFINNSYGPPANYFYGICSAPYWGGGAATPGESVDDLLAGSAASMPRTGGYLLAWTSAARYYGLHNFSYEGGPSMQDEGQVDLPNMLAANLDPRMGQQVTQALSGAFANGVDMYMYFTSSGAWSKYGMWGATNDILDLTLPKWQALQALAGKSITRTLQFTAPDASGRIPLPGTSLPGSIAAGFPDFAVVNGSLVPTRLGGSACNPAAGSHPAYCMLKANGELGYLVDVPQAGNYSVTLVLDDSRVNPAGSAELDINQKNAGTFTIPQTPKGTVPIVAPIPVMLPAGINLIELKSATGGFAVASIAFTAD